MKALPAAALVGVTATLAFFAGRWSMESESPATTRAGARAAAPVASAVASRGTPARQATGSKAERTSLTPEALTAEQARALIRKQRLDLMRTGALIFDGSRQAAFLEGVIAALGSKEELDEATAVLGKAQGRGNFCAQGVWDAMWKQWGKVDAPACLAGFAQNPRGKSRTDARHVMEGWYAADPAAALAWATAPRDSYHDAAAAG